MYRHRSLKGFSMKKLSFALVLAALAVIIAASPGQPCSTIKYEDDGHVIVGHNLDMPFHIPGLIVVNKRGVAKQGCTWQGLTSPGGISRGCPSWNSRFGSVTFNPIGLDFPDGGINEAGLVVCEMTLVETRYPHDRELPALFMVHWIQYLLDTCATVEEVIASANAISLDGWGWHFFVADAGGDCAVIEFLKGKPVVYTGDSLPYAVLCNAAYAGEVEALKDYALFGGTRKLDIMDKAVPRFACAATMLYRLKRRRGGEPWEFGFNVLSKLERGITQWSIVYDATDRKVYFRTARASRIRSFALGDFDFGPEAPPLILDVHEPFAGAAAARFEPFTPEANIELVRSCVTSFEKNAPDFFKLVVAPGLAPEDLAARIAAHPTVGVEKSVAPPAAEKASPPQKSAALAERLNAAIEPFIARQAVPGLAVGVVDRDRILFADGFGVASVESKKPVTERSLFHMASVSKLFTATAVMQLVEAGKIDLDTAVVIYLPYFELADEQCKEITVRQMLSHTSGMPDVRDYGWENPEYDDDALERYLRGLKNRRMIARPGERYAYSNMAYEVLGDVVAKVSGLSFEEYVQSRILDPLRMQSSTFLITDTAEILRTAPHRGSEPPRLSEVYPYNRAHAPSSTLHSSVLDMCLWLLVNLNRGSLDGSRILEAATLDEMWKTQAHRGPDRTMGLGWQMRDFDGQIRVFHGGRDVGYLTYVLVLPEESLGIVLLANSSEAPIREIRDLVLKIVLEH